jgi:CheY-like chemotaxis protein
MVRDCAACVSVSTLGAAREQLRQRRFDLVLLDLDLGGDCGWALLEDIERLEPRPPVIVFSASDAEAAEGREVQALLIKSQTTEAELLDAIQRALPGPVATA